MARSVRLNWIAILVAAVALWPAYPAAAGPAFGAQGSRFLVDGEPRFLLFVSYFDGLQRPADVRPADLAWLKARGVDGVRVWPNWSPPRLMDADGRVSGSRMRDLSAFVDAAGRAGLIVDVTFNREGVCASRQPCELTIPEYRDAITSVVGALQPHTNVLFDLQNEWNTYGEGITIEALTAIRDAVGAVDPSAIVTASTDSHYGEARAAAHAFDVLAFHNPRDAGGAWAHGSADLVKRLRGHLEEASRTIPIYLQEPNRFPTAADRFKGLDSTPGHYVASAIGGKRAGAAAWTFHTAAGFDLKGPTPFADLLLPAERDVIERLAPALDGQQWGLAAAAP